MNITIPVHPSLFNPGNNTLKISAESDANSSNYDDFEFYNVSLHLSEAEPVTLEPPLKVAWTYELPWELGYETPPEITLAADGVLYLAREDFGKTIIIALSAETGDLLWSKEWNDGQSVSLGYKDEVLFAGHSSNIMHWTQKQENYCGRKNIRVPLGENLLFLEIRCLSAHLMTDMWLLLMWKTGL